TLPDQHDDEMRGARSELRDTAPGPAAGVLGPPASGFPGADRPGRCRGGDRAGAVGAVGRPVLLLAARPGRHLAAAAVPRAGGRLAAGVAGLAAGRACGCARAAGLCAELERLEPALWTFAFVAEVEPTNNAAERALRHAVMWRKTSYGVQSEWGARFVERVLTVAATCRQQSRGVLAYLVNCCEAWNRQQSPPTLITLTNDQAA